MFIESYHGLILALGSDIENFRFHICEFSMWKKLIAYVYSEKYLYNIDAYINVMHCFLSDPTNKSIDFVFVEKNLNTSNLIAQSNVGNSLCNYV